MLSVQAVDVTGMTKSEEETVVLYRASLPNTWQYINGSHRNGFLPTNIY